MEGIRIKEIAGFACDCSRAEMHWPIFMQRFQAGKNFVGRRLGRFTFLPQGWILAFQEIEEYTPPVWPWEAGKQQQMTHIDFLVDNLEEAVAHALKCGAVKAAVQYFETSVTLFDPEGHPYCLSTVKQ